MIVIAPYSPFVRTIWCPICKRKRTNSLACAFFLCSRYISCYSPPSVTHPYLVPRVYHPAPPGRNPLQGPMGIKKSGALLAQGPLGTILSLSDQLYVVDRFSERRLAASWKYQV